MRWDSSQTHNRQSHHCTKPPQQHLQHNPQRKRTQSSSAAAIATTAVGAEAAGGVAAVGLVVLRRHDAVLSQATHLSSCCYSGSDPLLLLFRDPSLLRFHFSHGHHQKQHVCRSTSTITTTSCSQTSSSNHSRGYFLCHQLVGERWRDNFRRQSIAGCYTDLSRGKESQDPPTQQPFYFIFVAVELLLQSSRILSFFHKNKTSQSNPQRRKEPCAELSKSKKISLLKRIKALSKSLLQESSFNRVANCGIGSECQRNLDNPTIHKPLILRDRQTGDFAAGKIINLESGIWKQRDELCIS